jgi:Ca-activated chloride channel family protein
MGAVSLSYPLEYLRTSVDTTPLVHAALVTGGKDQAEPGAIWDAGGESIPYTRDLWPWVLLVAVGLLVLDTYAKRVRLFGYRTIRFR